MTTLDAENLVRKLEVENSKHPARFRAQVWRMIMLGYAAVHVLWMISLVLLLLMVWLVYLCFYTRHFEIVFFAKFFLIGILGLTGLLLLVARLLFYQPKLPAGFEITEKDAPRLFALLEEVRQKVDSDPFSHVYLNAELNAAVVHIPHLMGLLPGETNLVIGLPLLAALTKEETKAILAHEMGHLLRGDGSFAGWVFRNRLLWMGLGAYLNHTGGLISGPACAFFRWYVPLLCSYSLVTSREFEYQSDQLSVQVAGREITARALLVVHALGLYLSEKFSLELRENSKNIPQVPPDLFQQTLVSIDKVLQSGALNHYAAEALAKRSDFFDSHPCLTNRLSALGGEAYSDLTLPGENSLSLLEESWSTILTLSEHLMKQEWGEKWSRAHALHLKNYVILQRSTSVDNPPAQWNHLQVLEYVKAAHFSSDFEHAWEWVNYYVSLQPEEAIGYLIRGQMAKERRHESCVEDFRRAAVLSPKIAPHAYRLVIQFAMSYAPHLDVTADREALHQAELKQTQNFMPV